MGTMLVRCLIIAVLYSCVTLTAGSPAFTDEQDGIPEKEFDGFHARDAVERGELAPLREILRVCPQTFRLIA